VRNALGRCHSSSSRRSGVQVWKAEPLIFRHMEQWQCWNSRGLLLHLKRHRPHWHDPTAGVAGVPRCERKGTAMGPKSAGDCVANSCMSGTKPFGNSLSASTPAASKKHRALPSTCRDTKQLLPHFWQKCRRTDAFRLPSSPEHIERGPSFSTPKGPCNASLVASRGHRTAKAEPCDRRQSTQWHDNHVRSRATGARKRTARQKQAVGRCRVSTIAHA